MVNDTPDEQVTAVEVEEVSDTTSVEIPDAGENTQSESFVEGSVRNNEHLIDESRMATSGGKVEDLLVDSGCTSHMANDEGLFTEFDSTFKPEHHSLTLADGTKCSGMAEKRGKVEVSLTDSNGVEHSVTLNDVLYIPSYPQNMFSVHKANKQKASVLFLPNSAQLIAHDGTKFNIRKVSLLQ